MADIITQKLPELIIDPISGKPMSRNALEKARKKGAAKAKAQLYKQLEKAKKDAEFASVAASNSSAKPDQDPEAMFKQGFLKQVYNANQTPQVFTRFPPEPNGYLHLGHAKAIAVNFGFAKFHAKPGDTPTCYLRFDDTNPAAEEKRYFDAIEEMVSWLGFAPHQITHASDRFDDLYRLAEKLVTDGNAYVCHCNKEEIVKQRGGKDKKNLTKRYRCDHANRNPTTNLSEFRKMRDGHYKAGQAILRMRQDIEDDNPQMWDLAAYRIPEDPRPHARTGDKWKIYPMYDFAHSLCDSLEGITHSLCTSEFLASRQSYEWLNDILGVTGPIQREYGRLNLEGTIMSKRKLKKIVETGKIRGWDDPRIYTLIAIRRRGVPPGALLAFVADLGVTTADTLISTDRFEQTIRAYLETTVPRLMMVLDPVRLVIDSHVPLPDIQVSLFPKDPTLGSYSTTLSSSIYIDRSDFREDADEHYYRLKPGGIVGLLQIPIPIRATSVVKNKQTGLVTEIHAVFDPTAGDPKARIQWVPDNAQSVEVRLYKRLFLSKHPERLGKAPKPAKTAATQLTEAVAEAEEFEDDSDADEADANATSTKPDKDAYLKDINPDSETVYKNALIDAGFAKVKSSGPWPKTHLEQGSVRPEMTRFQAVRIGYFAMDSDSTADKAVLNQIVTLKQDSGK